jgi:hypothetical protein
MNIEIIFLIFHGRFLMKNKVNIPKEAKMKMLNKIIFLLLILYHMNIIFVIEIFYLMNEQ